MNYNGIVAMLDALGTRSLTIEDGIKFVEKRETLLAKIESVMDGLKYDATKSFAFMQLNSLKNPNFEDSYKSLLSPEIITFGDTIIIVWEASEHTKEAQLVAVSMVLGSLISIGIKMGLFLRGAISIGDYIFDDDSPTLLGPAIADAADWYEEADWIGIIATPHCGTWISMIEPQPAYYLPYSVPLKSSKAKKLWVINWPFFFQLNIEDKADLKKIFFSNFKDQPIPKGVEDKYYNTFDFFNYVYDKFFDIREDSKEQT